MADRGDRVDTSMTAVKETGFEFIWTYLVVRKSQEAGAREL